MRILVQKFGGTSVANIELRRMAIGHVSKAIEKGYATVVVVSAMGRKGDPYATDTLLNLLKTESDGLPKSTPRDLDLLMCCGETISSVVMAHSLINSGIQAIPITGCQAGIVTDETHGDAHIVRINPERLLGLLRSGYIPVVAGFQGATSDGEITTLGRGGSDTTASALGVALHAEAIEIFTDVEGIMTADPRMVPEAKVLDTVTYREVAEMAHMGAKVIHPRAVEIAMQDRVPLKIRSTMSDAPGTLITDSMSTVESVTINGDKVVTGIASISSMAFVRLGGSASSENKSSDPLSLFRVLAKKSISVDLISVSPEMVSFIVKDSDASETQATLDSLSLHGSVEIGFAKVSAVGAGMRGIPGVMASIVEALASAGIQIYQTTDSHTTISCLVKQTDMADAVRALHNKFNLA